MGFYRLYLKRVLFSAKTVFQSSSLFSLLGMALSVAVLTVALLAFNAVSSSLEQILIARQGHLRIQAESPTDPKTLLEDIEPYREFFADMALFLSFEGLISNAGNFKAVLLEAVQDEKLRSSSFLNKRILQGDLQSSEPFLVFGSDLAEELQLSAGSPVHVIVSKSKELAFSRKQARLRTGAIADFGQHQLNSSFALLPLSSVKVLGFDRVSGLNVWIQDEKQLDSLRQKMEFSLEGYFIQSWKDRDAPFFEVIESDKKIIFLVLLILVFSAGFNVSSSLFVQVFRKTKDISILKAMGAGGLMIRNLFVLNGIILGIVGSLVGILAGLLLCYGLVFVQNKWRFIPAKVYQVNELAWGWQSSDLFLIFIASLIVVILSSVLPAHRAAKMNVTTGLSHN